MSNAFTVLPMSQEMYLAAGNSYEGSITVANPAEAKEDFHYAISVAPYSVLDSEYTADLATMTTRSELVKWITIEQPTGVLAPNETATVKFVVNVPLDAPAGGQYAAIGVRSDDEADAGDGVSVQNVFELASLIFATIDGETEHEGKILDNQIPGFITNGLPTVGVTLTNNGNVHEVATVTIEIKNVLTSERVFPKNDQSNVFSELVMPSSTRYVTRTLDDLPPLGIYSVTQNVLYLGESSYNTAVMVSCPIWFLILVIVTLGAIIGTVAALIAKKIRKKKQSL